MGDLNQDSPLYLAEALANEIARAPAEALLGEVAGDLGDRRALAREFDAVVARALRQTRRRQIMTAVKNAGSWLPHRLFGKPTLVRVGTLATLLVAVVGYYYHDARRAVPPIEALNQQTGSPQQPQRAPSASALSYGDPAGRPALPAAPLPSPQPRSDFRKALAAYDTARAYEARERATAALAHGDYAAAIASFNDALRTCTNRCQPELRAELDLHLEQAQSALNSATPVALVPPPQPAANAAAPATSLPPLAWPVKGRITVRFGARAAVLARSDTQAQTADGIMIAVPGAADIRAAADGTVSSVGADEGSGRFVLIRHDNDLNTRYGHLRRVLVKISDQVHRGEIIAKGVVSSRGAEPEFFFEVQRGTLPVDPMQFLPHDQ